MFIYLRIVCCPFAGHYYSVTMSESDNVLYVMFIVLFESRDEIIFGTSCNVMCVIWVSWIGCLTLYIRTHCKCAVRKGCTNPMFCLNPKSPEDVKSFC